MASSSYKELEDKILDAGNRLLEAPLHADKLLPLLEEVESYLSKVEQSPPSSVHEAISSSSNALKRSELLRHSDDDVKVAVASCISEITRITAPEIPYSDDTMKEIFTLIVSTFEKLYDNSSVSYRKRVSIIETVSKVRSCVLMLDLECDSLVDEMFQHFFKSVRDYHPDIVISSMITIMTLVIEESEDISEGILIPLLDSVKFDNKELSPVAWNLGEKVLQKCGAKLKPYLMEAVKNMGILLNDYSNVVSSIYLETPEQKNDNDSSGNMVTGKVEIGTLHAKEVRVTPKQISNGVVTAVEDGCVPVANSSDMCVNQHNGSGMSNNNDSSDGLNTNKLSGAENKSQITPKRRGRKCKPKIDMVETCQIPHNDTDTTELPKRRGTKYLHNDEVEAQLDPKTCKSGDDIQNFEADDEGIDVATPTPIHRTREKSRNKSGNVIKSKGSTKERRKRTPKGENNTEEEPLGHTGNIITDDIVDGTMGPESADTPKNVNKIDSQKKTPRSSGKNVGNKEKSESITMVEGKAKRRRGRPSLSHIEPAPHSEDVKQADPESINDEMRKDSSKGKQTRETNNTPILKAYGPKLVGKRIKVWWPDDEKYYEGVIQSFIPTKKMHKIVYIDDDIEILDLRNEKWVPVNAKLTFHEEESPGVPVAASSLPGSVDPPKKRRKSKVEIPQTEEKQPSSSKRQRKVKSVEDNSGGGMKKRSKASGGVKEKGSNGKSRTEASVEEDGEESEEKRAAAAAEEEPIQVTTDEEDGGDDELPNVALKEGDDSMKESSVRTTKGRRKRTQKKTIL